MRRAFMPFAAMVGAILLWSIQDAIIWRGWFDGRPWSRTVDLYGFWHQAFLVALIVAGLLFLRGIYALWFAASTWVLSNSGLPDVLYYWLALKRIPMTLPWLDQTHPLVLFHPSTPASVLASSAIWLLLCSLPLGVVLLNQFRKRIWWKRPSTVMLKVLLSVAAWSLTV